MNLTRPTHVRALLTELGIQPSRALGQNFLIDANVLRILVEAATLEATDRVLEVGPGLGVLTEAMAGSVAELVAVEKDHRLAAYLKERFADAGTVCVIEGDMLKQRIDRLGSGRLNKVVANLPYRPGTRIVVDLVQNRARPESMVLTVQREVADRLAAAPGTTDYGVLSVWVQRLYDVELIKVVSSTCFWPAPAVSSAIVRLSRHARTPLPDAAEAVFYSLTKHAFTQRRKQLVTALRRAPEALRVDEAAVRAWLRSRALAETVRPQELAAGEWCDLVCQIVCQIGP